LFALDAAAVFHAAAGPAEEVKETNPPATVLLDSSSLCRQQHVHTLCMR